MIIVIISKFLFEWEFGDLRVDNIRDIWEVVGGNRRFSKTARYAVGTNCM